MLAVMRSRMIRTVARETKVVVRALNVDEVQLAKMRDAIVATRMVTP